VRFLLRYATAVANASLTAVRKRRRIANRPEGPAPPSAASIDRCCAALVACGSVHRQFRFSNRQSIVAVMQDYHPPPRLLLPVRSTGSITIQIDRQDVEAATTINRAVTISRRSGGSHNTTVIYKASR
jgi:hypothetical protein